MSDDYRRLAGDLLDYINTCNVSRAVPLRWDINHYTERLHAIEKEGKKCGSTSSARYRA